MRVLKISKKITAVLSAMAISLACLPVSVFGDEDTPIVDESKYVPRIKLSSISTIEIDEGKTQEIIIELKNVGTGTANSLFIQAVPDISDPFEVSAEILGGSHTLQQGVTKQVRLTFKTDSGAGGNVYPLKLSYSYTNEYRTQYDSTDTLNVKIKSATAASGVDIFNVAATPDSLTPGQAGQLSFNYMNKSSKTLDYLKFTLEDLDSKTITVPSGLSSQIFTAVPSYEDKKATFDIKAASGCKSGSYPIKIVTTTKNTDGTEVREELVYYIGVGSGGASEEDAVLDILNTSAPTQTMEVGKNFNLSFEIKNTSKSAAENLMVKAEAVEGGAIVPTSQSMIMTRTLKAGETKKYTFTFAATSSAKSQNYPIAFTIEYDGIEDSEGAKQKISFSQYFGVNINNPEEEEDEDTDEDDTNKNIPKIIISSYDCDPTIVKAGGEFTLNMTFMNSHKEKSIKNVKASLTVTDKDDKMGASIFSPVNASNTLYVDEISPKQEVMRSVRYYAVPDAQPQNYSINVNFEYEDAEGNQLTAQEIVGINVSQPPSIEVSEINIPEMADTGVPVFVNFEIFNTGKVAVNNLKVTIDGNIQVDGSKTTWIGNLESGSAESYDVSFYCLEAGTADGKITVSYDSTTGEHFEIPSDFSLTVNEFQQMDMMPEMGMDMPMEGEGGTLSKTKIAAICGGVVIAAIAGFLGFRAYRKKKKGNDFYE